MTYAERQALIIDIASAGPQRRLKGDSLAHWRAHIERLQLIYKPFPVVRRIGGSALPWSGTIVGDQFFGGNDNARRAFTSGRVNGWNGCTDNAEKALEEHEQ